MRVVVVGAGGVGGYYAGALARAGHDVSLLARGATLEAVRANGLRVRTPDEEFVVRVKAASDPDALHDPELVLVAVKSYALKEVAGAVRGSFAARGASVLPLLNGVDAADQLVMYGVPRDRVLGGVTYISAARVEPGVIERRSPFQRILLGELPRGRSSRVEAIANAFASAGVDAQATDDITLVLWQKYIFIVSMAAVCGLARTSIGPVREAPMGALLLRRAVSEAAAVARARGVALPPNDEERVLGLIDALPAAMMPSFLLDVQANAPTELDVLSGAVSTMGRAAGVPTVVHDTVTAAISAATAAATS